MSWLELLFMHWPVDEEAIAAQLPKGLQVDTYEGQAWLGVVPFRMENVLPRGIPWLPYVSAFAELNVRTYVRTAEGRPGVWFFSLDAANPVAVAAARAGFHLPYFRAQMSCERLAEQKIHYRSRRTHSGVPAGEFVGVYHPCGERYQSQSGTLEHWLTERYCLYAADASGTVFRGEIQHLPWPLQGAEVQIERNSVAEGFGFDLQGAPAQVHYVERIDVVGWTLDRLD